MSWIKKLKKRKSEIDTDALMLKAEASIAKTQAQQPRVNRITQYLEHRNNQNGFGEDFEISLIPKEA